MSVKDAPTASITVRGLDGDREHTYVLVEQHEDGSVLLAPETSWPAISQRLGGREATPAEFDEHFGHLPTDTEG